MNSLFRQIRPTVLTVLMTILLLPGTLLAKDLEQFMIRGYIYDPEYHALDSVTVTMTKSDTIAVPFKLLTGDNDTRMIKGNQLRAIVYSGMGKYQLTLYKDGYQPLIREFSIASVSEDLKYIPNLVMQKELIMTRELDEVTVQATRVKMVMKGDTIVFDASAFRLSEGSMLDELVRQLPNATLDENGVITVNGRKINDLLINGKDFFKGDPNVALKNLPSYTVKNIKVYDKAADDAYLTHSDARMDKREDDENLVMDVSLKKEYNHGWMANATAGYGTSDRYLGRAFGMGYTDKFRLSAFVTANNVGNTSKGGSEGNWSGGWQEDGLLTLLMGGVDYSYDDNDKWRATGNMTMTGEHVNSQSITATTSFYPSGDLYRRTVTYQKEHKRHFMSQHNIKYKGSNLMLVFLPKVDWLLRDRWSTVREATLNTNPEESYRGEVIDSLFDSRSGGSGGNYYRNMLTMMLNQARSNPGWINVIGDISGLLRPKSWKGYMTMTGNYNYMHTTSDVRTQMVQRFGPGNPDTGRPINRDMWNDEGNISKSGVGALEYARDNRKFGDERTTNLSWSVMAQYRYNYTNDAVKQYLGPDSVSMTDPLPSLIEPAGAILNIMTSNRTRSESHLMVPEFTLSWSSEPTTPGDSTFNVRWFVYTSVKENIKAENLKYYRPDQDPNILKRTAGYFSSHLNCGFGSSNKVRYMSMGIMYNVSQQLPLLSYMLDNQVSTDPLLTILPGIGLHRGVDHRVSFSYYRWNRNSHNSNISMRFNWNVSTNSVGMATIYDKFTGASIHQPKNINGNWSMNLYIGGGTEIGPSNKVELKGTLTATYGNSADYMTLDTIPVRSSVQSAIINPSIDVTYRPMERVTLRLGTYMTWRDYRSGRPQFVPFNNYDYGASFRADIRLPWDINLASSLKLTARAHYTDATMNSTEWLWNASIDKSLIKDKLTLKLEGVDILNSVKNITVNVNAQGNYERWRNSLPRYVMLSLTYRFNQPVKNGGRTAAVSF